MQPVIAMVLSDEREVFGQYSRPEPFFGTAPAALLEGLDTLDCSIHVLSCLQKPVAPGQKIGRNIQFHPLIVSKRGWLRSGYAGCILAIRKRLQSLRPDVVHGQGTERYCALGAAFSGVPNVITIHGNMRRVAAVCRAKPFTFAWCTAHLERFVLPRTQGVICPSTHTEREVKALASRTWVVPNAVDPSFFHLENSPAPEKILLCVATVYALKNQIGLIRALEPLAGRINFKLVFLGNPIPHDKYSEDFLELIKSRPWCQHAGFGDREAIKSHLRRATALILPSHEENCPMVILEAMAAGVPVLASRVGGIPDLVSHGDTGFLFEPDSAATIQAAVSQIFDDPSAAISVAASARTSALERFHPQVVASQHIAIYHELLRRNGNTA